jgi:cytoskeletal protein RodZ
MRLIGVISTAVLSLILAAPAYAQEQHDQQEEQKAKPEEKKAQPEKSAKPQEEKKAQPEKSAKPEEKSSQQQGKTNQQEEKNAQQQNKNNNKQEEKNVQQQNKNSQQEQKNAQEQQRGQEAKPGKQEQHAGGNGGGRIPDDRYRANFGREHSFHVSQGDYGNRRFEYGGYSFAFVGAWPSNWLYSQDVFVIEIDGVYYLCNPIYPGVNIALDVTL